MYDSQSISGISENSFHPIIVMESKSVMVTTAM